LGFKESYKKYAPTAKAATSITAKTESSIDFFDLNIKKLPFSF
jgi:hypothetical protein